MIRKEGAITQMVNDGLGMVYGENITAEVQALLRVARAARDIAKGAIRNDFTGGYMVHRENLHALFEALKEVEHLL